MKLLDTRTLDVIDEPSGVLECDVKILMDGLDSLSNRKNYLGNLFFLNKGV